MKKKLKCPFCKNEFKSMNSFKKHLEETKSEIANYSVSGNIVRRITPLTDFLKADIQ